MHLISQFVFVLHTLCYAVVSSYYLLYQRYFTDESFLSIHFLLFFASLHKCRLGYWCDWSRSLLRHCLLCLSRWFSYWVEIQKAVSGFQVLHWISFYGIYYNWTNLALPNAFWLRKLCFWSHSFTMIMEMLLHRNEVFHEWTKHWSWLSLCSSSI